MRGANAVRRKGIPNAPLRHSPHGSPVPRRHVLKQARQQKLKVVFLWLAAWKNGQSSYAPVWVKSNTRRFPRVVQNGNEVEILGTLGGETLKASNS
jgi:hypothetical protein